MPIDSAAATTPPGQGRASTARLMGYGFLAGLLMLLDQRGQFVSRIRALAEQAIAPVYVVAEAPVEAVRGISSWGRSYDTLLAQNEALRERLMTQSGSLQRLGALEEENRRLRALLEATAGRDLEFRFAELVQVSLDPYSHQVLVDRGGDDGVFVGQAVIDGLGVMGQVESVTGGNARVRLISDPEHAIPVQILRTGQRTVALGTGEAGRLSLPNLPTQADVRIGDRLVTSGLGERFPSGFPVADVTGVERSEGAGFLQVDAAPLAALDRGREVLLVIDQPAPVQSGTDDPMHSGADADAVTPVTDRPPETGVDVTTGADGDAGEGEP